MDSSENVWAFKTEQSNELTVWEVEAGSAGYKSPASHHVEVRKSLTQDG